MRRSSWQHFLCGSHERTATTMAVDAAGAMATGWARTIVVASAGASDEGPAAEGSAATGAAAAGASSDIAGDVDVLYGK